MKGKLIANKEEWVLFSLSIIVIAFFAFGMFISYTGINLSGMFSSANLQDTAGRITQTFETEQSLNVISPVSSPIHRSHALCE